MEKMSQVVEGDVGMHVDWIGRVPRGMMDKGWELGDKWDSEVSLVYRGQEQWMMVRVVELEWMGMDNAVRSKQW